MYCAPCKDITDCPSCLSLLVVLGLLLSFCLTLCCGCACGGGYVYYHTPAQQGASAEATNQKEVELKRQLRIRWDPSR